MILREILDQNVVVDFSIFFLCYRTSSLLYSGPQIFSIWEWKFFSRHSKFHVWKYIKNKKSTLKIFKKYIEK